MGVNKAAGIAVALWIFSFVPDAAKIFSGLLVELQASSVGRDKDMVFR